MWRKKSGSFPAERYFKGDIKGNSNGGGGGGSLRSSCNLPSIRHFSPLTQLALKKRKEKKQKNIHSEHRKARIIHSGARFSATRPHTVRSGFRVGFCGGRKKCTRGGRKRRIFFLPLFSLLPFSSPRFQAAMPHCRSLLQATPTPSEPTGWSSALQSQEPTAGSRQLHNNKKNSVAALTPRK